MTHILQLHDATITILCYISQLLGLISILLANEPDLLYVAASLSILAVMTTSPMRAWLSKIVGREDVGKVRSILHCHGK